MMHSQNKLREKKSKWRIVLESWPVLIILLGLVFFFTFGIADFWGKLKETKQNKIIAETELLEIKDRQEKLELDINLMESPQGRERIFREDFGLAKEGEGMIVVLDKDEDKDEDKNESFFGFFKGFFK